jgi:hypothetical protein
MAKKRASIRNQIGVVDRSPARKKENSEFKSCWIQF